jgi:hypothetical protein
MGQVGESSCWRGIVQPHLVRSTFIGSKTQLKVAKGDCSVVLPLIQTVTEEVQLVKRIMTLVALAVCFSFDSSSAIAEQSNGTGPVRLNAPRVEPPAQVIKPKQENQIPMQPPTPGNGGAAQGAPQQQSRPGRPPLTGVGHAPSSAIQPVRPRAVYREVGRRINIAGILVLPVVVYYGVPVILNVPDVGLVDVPEDEYARLYDKLSSSDSEQVQEAMSSLRKIKALEEAEVEAAQRGPEQMESADPQDLSEPIFFHSPSRAETRRRGLY